MAKITIQGTEFLLEQEVVFDNDLQEWRLATVDDVLPKLNFTKIWIVIADDCLINKQHGNLLDLTNLPKITKFDYYTKNDDLSALDEEPPEGKKIITFTAQKWDEDALRQRLEELGDIRKGLVSGVKKHD